jgi:hypothetical protein
MPFEDNRYEIPSKNLACYWTVSPRSLDTSIDVTLLKLENVKGFTVRNSPRLKDCEALLSKMEPNDSGKGLSPVPLNYKKSRLVFTPAAIVLSILTL